MADEDKKRRKSALDRLWLLWRPMCEPSVLPYDIEKRPFRGRMISDYTTDELEKMAQTT